MSNNNKQRRSSLGIQKMQEDHDYHYHHDGPAHYNRPRRPNLETVEYLRSLPLDSSVARDEIQEYYVHDTSSSLPPTTLHAALTAVDEIQNEIASLAGDEYGADCLEVLAKLVCPYWERAARTLLRGMSTYHLHLATHRYGSHVVQTILENSVMMSNNNKKNTSSSDLLMSLHHKDAPHQDDESSSLPSLRDLVLQMVDELIPHASQLAVHVCGSHVLRSLLCVLGGVVTVVSSSNNNDGQRGKIKKKKKKNKRGGKSEEQDTQHERHHVGLPIMEYRAAADSRLSLQDESIQNALERLTVALTGSTSSISTSTSASSTDGPGELQHLVCHASAGPLLIVLLRVLTYRYAAADSSSANAKKKSTERPANHHHLAIPKDEPHFAMKSPAHQLAQRILCWQKEANDECLTSSLAEKQKLAANILYGMSGEPRGSHMVETLLQLSPDEFYADLLELGDYTNPSTLLDYVQHDVSNFVIQTLLCTIRSAEQAETILKSVEKCISSGYVLNPDNKRRGIVWRAAELSAKYRVRQESLLKAVRIGMGLVYSSSKTAQYDNNLEASTETGVRKKKRRQKTDAISIPECVPKLLNITPPITDGGRVGLDPAGTRTVYHFLQFAPRLCGDVLQGITENLSREELEWIAKDGLGSRCVMDGMLDGPMNQSVFQTAAQSLLTKMAGRWKALAVDRVGHHVVIKLFRALPDINDKAVLVAELSRSLQLLSGNAMGRSVIEVCAVKEFLKSEDAWKDAVRKQQQREQFLKELDSEEQQDATPQGDEKKKRKRKRTDSDWDSESRKAAKRSVSTVETIFQQLSSAER